ncbi:hypothetical protein ACH5RR_032831 [Cinchona calisaya]|uniref:Disease resistance protein RGA3 n=1 Tax=Cinchona calisaya TaxID=153742 RepID=A0ABD2YJ72_9GENT
MADAMLGSAVQVLLEKAISSASQQIGFFVGFKKDLEKLKETLTMIQAFIEDADKKQVTETSVKLWLEKLERVAFDAENLLDDFNYEILRRKVEIQNQMKRKVCFFFSLSNNPIAFRFKMANKIQNINLELKSISDEATNLDLLSQIGATDATALPTPIGFTKDRETVSVTVDPSFVGRDDDVSHIVTQLTVTTTNETVSILPIVGMGGIGKTTLARKVFNDLKIEKHFDKRIWVCVSDEFNINKLFGLILEPLQGRKPEVESMEAKVNQLKELLDGKKYLLVLDDVWNEQTRLWNDFLGSLKGISSTKGNCILVTTRKLQVVAPIVETSSNCSLKQLSDDECWLILEAHAFGSREVPDEFQDIGFQMAKKCRGLPLAASVLGGMLRNKRRDEWLKMIFHNVGDDENSVNEILKLSFDHLPYPSLKNCFAYCSIFRKDFEINKNQLIQLWAAEGFLHSNLRNNMDMEKVGDIFFHILLDNNLLQDVEKDEYGNVLNCKMHDLVHDLVQSISKSKTTDLEDSRIADEHKTFPIRYLTVERSDGEEIPFPLNKNFTSITTLILLENISINDDAISFFNCLRVFIFASKHFEKIAASIGKLSHLRYLGVLNNGITTLPDSVSKLYNLQTLLISNCESLRTFPNNFKNLVSLRHFNYFTSSNSSDRMPLEMGLLNCLQTLPFFNIGKEKGRQIEQLKSLNNLSGKLEIRNIELVKGQEEAESANLTRKSNIHELRLSWGNDRSENENKDNQVLEGLQPHPNVKGLKIENFLGDQISTWIGKLDKLVELELRYCKKCKELPTLGNIPFLRSLRLKGLESLTSIGPSFYGGSTNIHASSQGSKKLFPALLRLYLTDMTNLTEWTEATSHGIMAFPILEKIEIKECPQLTTVPSHFPSLKRLNISQINHGLGVITTICSRVCTLTSLDIRYIGGLTHLPNELFQNNPNVKNVELFNCPDLNQFLDCVWGGEQGVQSHTNSSNLVGLVSLERLSIQFCTKLKSISIPSGHQYLSALGRLWIFNCFELTHLSIPQLFVSKSESYLPLAKLFVYACSKLPSFPLDLNSTPSLSTLHLHNCDNLTTLPKGRLCSLTNLRELHIGPFSKNTTQLHSFQDLFSNIVWIASSLRDLALYGRPHWDSLPDQLQHLSALTDLKIRGFGVKSLPDWFGKLSSLEKLNLYNCEKLEHLPSHQSMTSLARLQYLCISDCPLLKERCRAENGSGPHSDWSKISHIHFIVIDSESFKDGRKL